MVRQINPSLARLWLKHDIRRYGTHNPIELTSLAEKELRVLDLLELGVTEEQLRDLPEITGASKASVDRIVQTLGSRLVKTSSFLPEMGASEVNRRFAEISRLFLAENGDPAELLRGRRRTRVFLDSLSRTGLVIAKALDASEIGRIITMDQARVKPSDTLSLGYERGKVGTQRAKAASALMENSSLELHSRHSRTTDEIELAILISNDVVNPLSYQTWMARDVPHVSVCFDEVGVEVSQVVIPGQTPCLGCAELARHSDPERRVIAPQLLALDRSNEDSATLLFGASMILNQALNFIDRTGETSWCYRLERAGDAYRYRNENASCGCRLVSEENSGHSSIRRPAGDPSPW